MILAAGGATCDVRAHPGDGGLGVGSGEFELDVAFEVLKALLAGELGLGWSEDARKPGVVAVFTHGVSLSLIALVVAAGAIAAGLLLIPGPHHAAGGSHRGLPLVSQYPGAAYSAEYPAGWSAVEAERPIGTFLRSQFVSPDARRSVIIDRAPGESLSPRAKALAVESATERMPGYRG